MILGNMTNLEANERDTLESFRKYFDGYKGTFVLYDCLLYRTYFRMSILLRRKNEQIFWIYVCFSVLLWYNIFVQSCIYQKIAVIYKYI